MLTLGFFIQPIQKSVRKPLNTFLLWTYKGQCCPKYKSKLGRCHINKRQYEGYPRSLRPSEEMPISLPSFPAQILIGVVIEKLLATRGGLPKLVVDECFQPYNLIPMQGQA